MEEINFFTNSKKSICIDRHMLVSGTISYKIVVSAAAFRVSDTISYQKWLYFVLFAN